MQLIKVSFILLFTLSFVSISWGQLDSTQHLKVSLEFRPRTEFRNGYRTLRNDTTTSAFFTSNRARLNITFTKHFFSFHTSLQDMRIWGQFGQISSTGSLSVFESYVDAYLDPNWYIRLGRQAVELDNKRIFSAANWNQSSRAHDGVNLFFDNQRIRSDLMLFFNQTRASLFGTDFNPAAHGNYKFLGLHHAKMKLSEKFHLVTINAYDGYQKTFDTKGMQLRGTSGGRITYNKNKWKYTISGYYQYGKLQNGIAISSFYFQPELMYKTEKSTSRLGMEYMSGGNASSSTEISRSFVPLYGVGHSFMGHMDYFTKFPGDVKNGGLINPYFFLKYNFSDKLSLHADFHLFLLENIAHIIESQEINPFLGFENDVYLHFNINEYTTLDFELAYLGAGSSMAIVKGGDKDMLPVWSSLMLTFKPEIINRNL